ncbi:ATP-dependent Clp protease ATP-binding subunit [Candidatus Bipolaricaulota bacterium]|nr:ATP-dependent Clp protease ATP-binding subunit [Candidatus Bipolaricaulota bacterium]MBS3814214.1 ATP-dependent Clp protease ATP-binding subunit [Candidatus Bipolaricaulota bacterium]MBS3825020.1 ATP-dependent Clp protease ATP-binding subunit [Candidatus Bipolaricaulota bacterium]
MYKKFSKKSMEIMATAYDEAEKLNDKAVSPEHLLLALLRAKNTRVYKFLKDNGLSYHHVLRVVKRNDEEELSLPLQDELEPTSKLKKIMKMGYDEARSSQGENKIEPAHLLISILEEGNGTASSVIKQFGVTSRKARSYFSMVRKGDSQQGMELKLQSTEKSSKEEGILEEFGRNLIEEANKNNLDPVIGRGEEINRVIQTLTRRKKNNPVLIGEAGVGKTAIVEGLAQKIANQEVPQILSNRKIYEVDMAAMVAGTKYRGEFEQRLKALINEVTNQSEVILFIDELSTVVGAGGAEGAIDASSILKPPLASGAIQSIGTATIDDYRKSVEKDPALKRRFKTITIEEPTIEHTIEILEGIRDRYESHHNVKITDEAIEQAARLSDRYITGQFLPDKAIDLIDETSAKVRLENFNLPPELREISRERLTIKQREEEATDEGDYEKAAELRDKRLELTEGLEEYDKEEDNSGNGDGLVEGKDIAEMVSSWTGVPVGRLQKEERKRMVDMEQEIHKRLIGQDEAVNAISQSLRRAYAGVKDPNRPIGSFMFLGPTGVGKTELSKTLADFLFGDEEALIRVDMSEYMEKFNVSRLTGAPPGYVGYEEAGKLTEAVRHRPHSVILFDEIEKAHSDVFNILLQVMEDGVLTDSQGRQVNFRNSVMIMTSNLGGKLITDKTQLGFGSKRVDSKESYTEMKNMVMEKVKDEFRPEFLNRLDDLVVFHQLTEDEVFKIADLMLDRLDKRLIEKHGLKLELSNSAKELLVEKGYDPKYGARPMRRTIERLIENEVSDHLLQDEFDDKEIIYVDSKEGDIKLEGVNRKSAIGVGD